MDNIEEEYYTDIEKYIKELEKQDKFYERMANSGALDRGHAFEARQIVKEKLEIARQKQRKIKKLRKQFMAQQASESEETELHDDRRPSSKKHSKMKSRNGMKHNDIKK